MSAVLVGIVQLGDAAPGLADTIDTVGTGLQGLADDAAAVAGTLGGVANLVDAAGAAADGVYDELTAGVRQDIDDQFTSIGTALGELNGYVGQAAQYLEDTIAQLDATKTLLAAVADAEQHLTKQLDAVQAGSDSFRDKLNAIDSDLNDLATVSDDIAGASAAIREAESSLLSGIGAAQNAIVAFNEATDELLNSGVAVVHHTGPLSGLGSAVDTALVGTGWNGTASVSGPLLICQTANASTLAALSRAFGL